METYEIKDSYIKELELLIEKHATELHQKLDSLPEIMKGTAHLHIIVALSKYGHAYKELNGKFEKVELI